MRKNLFILMLLVLVLVPLSGCLGVIQKLDIEVKLLPDENWDFTVQFSIPENMYAMSEQEIQSGLIGTQEDAQASGLDFEWNISDINSEGNIVVSTTYSGQGYQTLNEEVFETNSITIREVDGEQILYFNISTYRSGLGEIFLLANESSFMLEGGEILSTNGNKLDNNSVIWYNPSGVLEAEMKPPSNNNIAYYLIGGGALLVVIAAYNLIKNRYPVPKHEYDIPQQTATSFVEDKTDTYPVNQEPTSKRYCVNCGSPLPEGANFCIKCGTKQP